MKKKILLLLNSGFKFENILNEFLSRDGFEVTFAHSVDEVLNTLKRSAHSLLIVEQDTYEMDCLELFLNVRDIQSNIHVLFLGSEDQKNKEEIIKLGGIYFDSPFQAETFRKTINGLAESMKPA